MLDIFNSLPKAFSNGIIISRLTSIKLLDQTTDIVRKKKIESERVNEGRRE